MLRRPPDGRRSSCLYPERVPALLEIRDLVKIYSRDTRALDGISLDIRRGEFVVLIGLSGSGKSTLLRCINRLVEPTSGQVSFEGNDVTRGERSFADEERQQLARILTVSALFER